MKIENTSELRLLVECARRGSLSAASREMQLSPAAASAMLKRLETRLGVRLMERSTRALRLTAAGEQLREYAQRALELLDEGLAQVSEAPLALKGRAGERLRGRIRLSASSDLTRQWLLPMLDDFLAQHPAVELHLSVSDSLQDIFKDEIDVALRYGQLPDSSLVARRLALVRREIVASPAYLKRAGTPRSLEDLAKHDCITFRIRNRHERAWRLRPAETPDAEPVSAPVQGRLSTDDGEIAHRWALEGLGLIHKSELDVRRALREGTLVRVLPGWLGDELPLHAVMPSQRFLPQRVRALVDHLVAGFAALPAPRTAKGRVKPAPRATSR